MFPSTLGWVPERKKKTKDVSPFCKATSNGFDQRHPRSQQQVGCMYFNPYKPLGGGPFCGRTTVQNLGWLSDHPNCQIYRTLVCFDS